MESQLGSIHVFFDIYEWKDDDNLVETYDVIDLAMNYSNCSAQAFQTTRRDFREKRDAPWERRDLTSEKRDEGY